MCDAWCDAWCGMMCGVPYPPVVTSPLTRCVQTALGSFPTLAARSPLEVPFVAHESVRETVNFPCDAHRPLSTLAAEFPRVDFSGCAQSGGHDRIWALYDAAVPEGYDGPRESADLVGGGLCLFVHSLIHSRVYQLDLIGVTELYTRGLSDDLNETGEHLSLSLKVPSLSYFSACRVHFDS